MPEVPHSSSAASPPYRDVVCKGSWALGSACGRCQRCLEEAPAYIKILQQKISYAEADANMYAQCWQQELGPWMAGKRHHIDACILGTQALVAAEKAQRPYLVALSRWKKDAVTARTLGLPPPDLLYYLTQEEIDRVS